MLIQSFLFVYLWVEGDQFLFVQLKIFVEFFVDYLQRDKLKFCRRITRHLDVRLRVIDNLCDHLFVEDLQRRLLYYLNICSSVEDQ